MIWNIFVEHKWRYKKYPLVLGTGNLGYVHPTATSQTVIGIVRNLGKMFALSVTNCRTIILETCV